MSGHRFVVKRPRSSPAEPLPGAWTGAWLGVSAVTTGLLAWFGGAFSSDRGAVVDALTAVVLGWAAIGLLASLLLVLGWAVRWIPTRLRAVSAAGVVVVGALGLWTALWSGPLVAGLVLAAGGVAGAGLMGLARRTDVVSRPGVSAVAAAVGVVALGAGTWWLAAESAPRDPGGPAPSGPHAVRTLSYGSGMPSDRPEFGTAATVRTEPWMRRR